MAMARGTDRPEKETPEFLFSQKGSTTIYAGAVVVAASDGYAKPGVAAASLRFLGVAAHDSVNAGADGAKFVRLHGPIGSGGKPRAWKFKNDATTPLTIADVGKAAALKDDETFSGDATSRTTMGKLLSVESDGVWMQFSL